MPSFLSWLGAESSVESKEQKIMGILAEEIRKEIDDQVLEGIRVSDLRKKQWTEIKLTQMRSKREDGMDEWLKENCKNGFFCARHSKTCFFENSKDAVMFTLRWAQ